MVDKIILPYAPVLVESTRSIGYSFETAVADIIDNSISAAATDIRICFMSKEPQWLCIEDNGYGMTEDKLETAMRYGSCSPSNARRKDDLGRFGLGLKTASLSQCRKLTVMSKCQGHIVAACWDLDHIIQTGDWSLSFWSEEEIRDLPGYLFLETHESGTVVLWQKFDRLQQESSNVQQTFDEKIEMTRKHISLVFHRFLNGDGSGNRISISFNGDSVVGVDPFLTRHPATQPMIEQLLRINGEEIRVKPYILPFASKLSAKDIQSIGGTNDLRQQQGFYIYATGGSLFGEHGSVSSSKTNWVNWQEFGSTSRIHLIQSGKLTLRNPRHLYHHSLKRILPRLYVAQLGAVKEFTNIGAEIFRLTF